MTTFFPFSVHPFYTLEKAPVLPVLEQEYVKDGFAVRKDDGKKTILWYPSGHINVYENDSFKIWEPRPTMQTAIEQKPQSITTTFHSNGAVTASYGSVHYYWSAPRDTEAEEGPFETAYWHVTEGWIFESDEVHDENEEYDAYYYRYGRR